MESKIKKTFQGFVKLKLVKTVRKFIQIFNIDLKQDICFFIHKNSS